MTKKQFEDIKDKLKIWREERHLTQESQREGLLGNLLEECTEYARAKDDLEKIDALCDIVVFCLNAYEVDKVYSSRIDDYFESLLAEIGFYYNDKEYTRYINHIVDSAISTIKHLGFNPYECMLETIKEISSRIGHYDKELKKFVKDTSEEAKSKWYKADYERCRV